MSGNVYLLLTSPNQLSPDIICSRDTKLKIRVHNLALTHVAANASEIQLYAYYDHSLLMFETINIVADDAMEVILAIKWYTAYLGMPDMEVLPEDPRPGHNSVIAV